MSQSMFNDLEALKIAISTENRGERFYYAAMQKVDDPEMREMLKDLAMQEREHADTFKALYDKALGKKGEYDDTYLFDPEVVPYFRAMFDTAIFPSDQKQDELLSGVNNVNDVLRLGMQAEKESILFYTEMVIHSKYPEAKEAFRRLIQEEKKHLIDLQSRLRG